MRLIQKTPLLFAVLFFTLSFFSVSAQVLDHQLGQLLIQTDRENHIHRIIDQYKTFRGEASQIQQVRKLRTIGHVFLVEFDHTLIHEQELLHTLRRNPLVITAQFNHLLQNRQVLPNDPSLFQQWFWVTDVNSTGAIDADLAWETSTGGQTPDGQDIVVAVIDDGIDTNHPDLKPNLWVNTQEIPNNGIDDDGNGYIDDYKGWNINEDNDDIEFSPAGHGVTVAGMIGAQGNNGTGITGVNWNSKIMMIKNEDGINQAIALEAYAYPFTMRKLYNETNGARGAFVVASNASWGLNFADASEAPIWCNFYDSLGQVGIVNCAATTNLSINVDTEGDLPTTCPSDYLIAVTRTGIMQEQGGGYGPINIDLGAPGIGIYSTEKNSAYGVSTGTSLSSPLVAGMVAFLYSIPNNQLAIIAKGDPEAAAALAKDYILEGVKTADGFETLVATGGIANLYNSTVLVEEDVFACLAPFGLKVSGRTDTELTMTWTYAPSVNSVDLMWKEVGSAGPFEEIENVSSPYTLTGLSPCTEYEILGVSHCNSGSSEISKISVFTDGCCTAPENILAQSITDTSALISWENIFAALSYEIDIRLAGTIDWTTISTSVNTYEFTDLNTCSDYEIRIKTICTGLNSEYGEIFSFSTLGCGNCQDIPYCEVVRNTQYEYIDKVVFNGVENQSGDNGGYAQFFTLPIELDAGETYPIELTPGYPGFNYTDDFEVWIDFNEDGDFDDAGEAVLFIDNTTQTVTGDISIPAGLPTTNTRMRITIYFMGPSVACAAQQDGETEDYCITINGVNNDCDAPLNLSSNVIDDFTTFTTWDAVPASNNYIVSWKKVGTNVWEEQNTSDNSYLISGLSSCTEYDFRVRSNCNVGTSSYANGELFKTKCKTGVAELDGISSLQIFPNPFSQELFLEVLANEDQDIQMTLYNLQGQMIERFEQQSVSTGYQSVPLAFDSSLASGVYFMRIEGAFGMIVQRLVKL